MAVLLPPVWFVLSVLFVSHAFPVSLISLSPLSVVPPLAPSDACLSSVSGDDVRFQKSTTLYRSQMQSKF